MERLLDDRPQAEIRENTLSRLRQSEMDELRGKLTEMSGISIFGRSSSQHWMLAYRCSYACMESADSEAPTLKQLRTSVKKELRDEAALITEQEEDLLKRLLLFGGMTPLFAEEEMPAALSLIRRLWCSCVIRENGQILIRLADTLIKPMVMAVASDQYREMRAKMYALSATLRSMVYLHGMLYAEPAITHLSEHLFEQKNGRSMALLYRYLMADFDYCLDSQGTLVLMHPGLIRPRQMLASISNARYQAADYSREMILGGMSELLKEEASAADMLQRELAYTLQPGYNPVSMVNDLKILVKQGATHAQLRELISDKLTVRMTDQLDAALRKVESDTVRWQNTSSKRLN